MEGEVKYYKLWIEIEEVEIDARDREYHRDLTEAGEARSIRLGVVDTLEEALEAAEGLEHCLDRRGEALEKP